MLTPMALGALGTEPWGSDQDTTKPGQHWWGSRDTPNHAATLWLGAHRASPATGLLHVYSELWLYADGCKEQGEVWLQTGRQISRERSAQSQETGEPFALGKQHDAGLCCRRGQCVLN